MTTANPASATSPIEFSIPMAVRAKQGDRSRIATSGRRLYVRHHMARPVAENAKALGLFASRYAPPEPLEGPVRIDLAFVVPWRISESTKARALGQRPKDTKPDLDNLAKQVCDMLQSLGFYKNDSQIADLRLTKYWGTEPRLDVRMERLRADAPAGAVRETREVSNVSKLYSPT